MSLIKGIKDKTARGSGKKVLHEVYDGQNLPKESQSCPLLGSLNHKTSQKSYFQFGRNNKPCLKVIILRRSFHEKNSKH